MNNLPNSFGKLNDFKRTRYGNMLYNKHDVYIGRSIEHYGEYSYGEAQLFEVLARPGNTVVDVGANIGCHTLCLAQTVGEQGKVYAFEPQRLVFQTLCANMAMNSITNAYCYHAAAGKVAGMINIPVLDYGKENNYGGLGLEADYPEGESVARLVIDDLHLSACHFIKIDVEGMEIDVLEGACNTINTHTPLLYVENDRRDKSPALLDFILKAGYRVYWHMPALFNPNNYYANKNNIFSRTCSVNVIGIPGFCSLDLKGFKEIKSATEWYEEGS